jgi:hypothetical protein
MRPRSAQSLKILSRRTYVANLYLRGYRDQFTLAERVGVDRSTIYNDLKHIRKQWAAEMVVKFDKAVVEELAKVDQLEREAWAEWERSKTFREKTRTGKTRKSGGDETSAMLEKENLLGDPRYLDVVLRCIDRRCKLLGLDAPEKLEVKTESSVHVVEQIIVDRREVLSVVQQGKYNGNGHGNGNGNGNGRGTADYPIAPGAG